MTDATLRERIEAAIKEIERYKEECTHGSVAMYFSACDFAIARIRAALDGPEPEKPADKVCNDCGGTLPTAEEREMCICKDCSEENYSADTPEPEKPADPPPAPDQPPPIQFTMAHHDAIEWLLLYCLYRFNGATDGQLEKSLKAIAAIERANPEESTNGK